MTTERLISKTDATEVSVDGSRIREYYVQSVPNLGLATAVMNGTYPPQDKGVWACNESVDEMYYVLAGTATIVFQDGITVELQPESAVHLPLGLIYRVEDARRLHVVVATGPVWSAEQHKWSTD